MEEIVQQNINTLNTQINKCRVNGEYCDVDFLVEGNVFECHRLVLGAASTYFKAMFDKHQKLKKGTTLKIVLGEIDASVFQAVLEFVYTGNVSITDKILFDMVRASLIFQLPGLEELCIEYIAKNVGPPFENVFETLTWASSSTRVKLCHVLGWYILKNLDYFYKTDKFLDTTFDELDTILLVPVPCQNWSIVVRAMVQWMQYGTSRTLEERRRHFNALVNQFNLVDIFPNYTKYLTKTLVNSRSDDCEEDLKTERAVINSQSLYLYIESTDSKNDDTFTNVFTLNESKNWEWSSKANFNFNFVRSIALDNQLYSLGYSKELPVDDEEMPSGSQWDEYWMNPSKMRRKSLAARRKKMLAQMMFTSSSSASMFVNAFLKPPPVILSRFEMCGIAESIFVYNRNASSIIKRNRQVKHSHFNKEELDRGVYEYKRDADVWLPLPAMIEKKSQASMACDNQRVYVIGGDSQKLVQAYDYRARDWQMLAPTSQRYRDAACCVHQGKIHICSSIGKNVFMEKYDPVAGKWEEFPRSVISYFTWDDMQLLSCNDNLLILSRCEYLVNVIEYREGQMFPLESVYESIKKMDFLAKKKHSVLDAVMFTSYGL